VFERAKAEIIQHGYPCEVCLISRRYKPPGDSMLFTSGIWISTRKRRGAFDNDNEETCTLQYGASVETREVSKSMAVPERSSHWKQYPSIRFSQVTAEMVEEDLEEFLSQVFSL